MSILLPPTEWSVPSELKQLALDAIVRTHFGESWGKVRGWIESGKVLVNGATVTDARFFPGADAKISLKMNAPRSRSGASSADKAGPQVELSREQVVHVDTQLIVVNKPSGISSVPYDASEKNTLLDAVCRHLKVKKVEIVHRIDKETSGLLVFARTEHAARHLGNQFRFHSVHRRYLALVHGHATSRTIRSTLIENRGDGLRGSVREGWRVAPGEGQEATTHVEALKRYEDMSLVACRLETGRTHQIRIHLSEAGHPLLGEKLYIRDYEGILLRAPRVMLHAAELGFVHPVSGAQMSWKSELPEDFKSLLEAAKH
jgi:23S rRNA pseudouridine1911/1915/1917 synthase